VYPDEEEFWTDLSAAYADQVQALAKLGCTYLQLDDTSLAYLNDPAQRAELTERGDDAEHQHLRYIRQINAAIQDRPAGMAVTTHMCRGNYRSSWAASGSYDFVARRCSASSPSTASSWSTTTSARAASRRCGSCRRQDGRAGLVTTKRGELESKDELKRRIDEAASTSRWSSSACPPVRLLVHSGGQRAQLRRAGRQAPPDRRDGGRGLGLTVRAAAVAGRAGVGRVQPAAGHLLGAAIGGPAGGQLRA
jgi:methionine synthase II (cobalamin-independent)